MRSRKPIGAIAVGAVIIAVAIGACAVQQLSTDCRRMAGD
jgi:hypothetical protein